MQVVIKQGGRDSVTFTDVIVATVFNEGDIEVEENSYNCIGGAAPTTRVRCTPLKENNKVTKPKTLAQKQKELILNLYAHLNKMLNDSFIEPNKLSALITATAELVKAINNQTVPNIINNCSSKTSLHEITTCELVNELKIREGVAVDVIEPYEKLSCTHEGPATILTVID